jgi:hypothetical protein
MPRVLSYAHQQVTTLGREPVERLWRERREVMLAYGCRYWLFQSATDETTILEFTEAGDAATLIEARRRAGLTTDVPIYHELELS